MGWQWEKVGGERQKREAWGSQLKGQHPSRLCGGPPLKESNDIDKPGVKVIEKIQHCRLWSKSRVKIPTFKDATIEQTRYQMNNVTWVILDVFLHFCVSDFKTLFSLNNMNHIIFSRLYSKRTHTRSAVWDLSITCHPLLWGPGSLDWIYLDGGGLPALTSTDISLSRKPQICLLSTLYVALLWWYIGQQDEECSYH